MPFPLGFFMCPVSGPPTMECPSCAATEATNSFWKDEIVVMLFGVAAQAGLFGGLTWSGSLGPGSMLLGRTMACFAADMAEIMSHIEDHFSWLVESSRDMAGKALKVELLPFVFQGVVSGGMFGAAPFLELRFMAVPAGDASCVIFWKNFLFLGEGSRNPSFGRKFAEPVYFGGGRLDNGENSRVVG